MLMIDFDDFLSNRHDTSSDNEMGQLQKKLQRNQFFTTLDQNFDNENPTIMNNCGLSTKPIGFE